MNTLDKRTADIRRFDIDCTDLLEPTETILSVTSMSADQGIVTFGTPVVNTVAITYPDNRVAAIGKVVQVVISGGAIPANVKQVLTPVRCLLVTTINAALEATVILRLIDTPNL